MKKVVLLCFVFSLGLLTNALHAQQGPGGDGPNGERPDRPRGSNGPGGGDGPGGGNGPRGGNGGNGDNGGINAEEALQNAEERLQAIIQEQNLEPISINGLPDISDPVPQLGKQLFFAKNLGGEQSAACVTCHHPVLGGGDSLSLPVGVAAVDSLDQSNHELLGHGRFNGNDINSLPSVPRNAPTVFNAGLNNRAMFFDGRIERRRNGDIFTPDSNIDALGNREPDANLPDNTTLAAAQAKFPVTSADEMRGDFEAGANNQELRNALTERFNNNDPEFISLWPNAFEQAFGDQEVTFDRIAEAIGEYERSMTFTNSPWNAYLNGDTNALTDEQKAGAVIFFSRRQDGGAGCSRCHSGSTLSSRNFQLVAFPQFGPGKGNSGPNGADQDFGRELVTGDSEDRFHFRAPSLLNVAVTSPYGHAGTYQTLEEVVAHYNNPRRAINRLFAADEGQPFTNGDAPFCDLPQIRDLILKNGQSCESLYPNAYANSMQAVEHLEAAREGEVEARFPLRRSPQLSPEVVAQVVAFMEALTDPCVEDRSCLAPWIIDADDEAEFPDNNPLIAEDENGAEL